MVLCDQRGQMTTQLSSILLDRQLIEQIMTDSIPQAFYSYQKAFPHFYVGDSFRIRGGGFILNSEEQRGRSRNERSNGVFTSFSTA